MKTKKLKKLVFNKNTISNLSEANQNLLRGGTGMPTIDPINCPGTEIPDTCPPLDTDYPCNATFNGKTCVYPRSLCIILCELP